MQAVSRVIGCYDKYNDGKAAGPALWLRSGQSAWPTLRERTRRDNASSETSFPVLPVENL